VEERIDAHYLLRYALAVPGDRAMFQIHGIQGAFMKSYDAKDHGASDQVAGQAKKPWVTPSLDIIALKSAEQGTHPSRSEGGGAHFQRPRS
jgi:hypothetical protein